MNLVVLIGRLTADPLAGDNPERPRAAFTLACDERFAKGNQTQFIPCVAWGNLATFAVNYLHKGSLVEVHGRISRQSYVSKTTNQNVVSFNVVADKINFVNFGGSGNNTNQPANTNTNSVNPDQSIDINDIFPESTPTINMESSKQVHTDAKFDQSDDLEWFDNIQKEDKKGQ